MISVKIGSTRNVEVSLAEITRNLKATGSLKMFGLLFESAACKLSF